ncbi:hypothetical protein ARALYDRAFT_891855 [Arabidopsis lyrata subsp. lyrata]|uniref:Uncharacterized protein n=1 Tax=Arabidopsis lyrata subsp. lyrata TaxID=81972 RepID=D7KEY5_ARALL|nr:hypothetical protein ARALYDRAFT_891855 [Arabidopsis lyrata subsp. lyrata]
MIRRLICAAISSVAYLVLTAFLLTALVTEELVFPACMIPLLLCAGFRIYSAIFLFSLSFFLYEFTTRVR